MKGQCVTCTRGNSISFAVGGLVGVLGISSRWRICGLPGTRLAGWFQDRLQLPEVPM